MRHKVRDSDGRFAKIHRAKSIAFIESSVTEADFTVPVGSVWRISSLTVGLPIPAGKQITVKSHIRAEHALLRIDSGKWMMVMSQEAFLKMVKSGAITRTDKPETISEKKDREKKENISRLVAVMDRTLNELKTYL